MRQNLRKLNTRLWALVAACVLLLSVVPRASADELSGTCGDNLTWTLSAGTLTISGSGPMTDFPETDMAPWYAYRAEIFRLELPQGLTTIGDLAFYGCEELTAVVIPDSVTAIGDYAFTNCCGLELLNLGSGVQTIGEAAFSDCVSLTALRLPESLRSMGMKAFYRCESIPSVTVPAGVTSMGLSAFGYCKSLVTADIRANISAIPEYLFYGCEKLASVVLPDSTENVSDYAFRGCDNLSSVYYDGSSKTPEEIREIINTDVPGFDSTGSVSDDAPGSSASASTFHENGDGTITQNNTTVTQGDNAAVSTDMERVWDPDSSGGSFSADINVTVEGESGWEDATKLVEDALKKINEAVTGSGGTAEDPVSINVYVKDTDSIGQGFIDALAGRDVRVTIVTENGSTWRLDASALNTQASSGVYDLSYTISAGSAQLSEELGTANSFVLCFRAPAEINAEVLIRLGDGWAYQNATLFQRLDGTLTQHQTVVVDKQGYAHFYLASVNDESEYYIAMNLIPEADDAIIPDELLEEYGEAAIRYTPIQYEITGRTSSWGMDINQVTWIMVGVLGGTVVIVGVVMFILNKRKLQNGYVPDFDDEDYDDE